jgi:aminoglycoside 3-N-acetyltransferase
MQEINLFKNSQNNWITNIILLEKLQSLNIQNTDCLYVHSSINFGSPNPDLNRNIILGEIIRILKFELNVKNLIMPTYTFSYCNGKDFDINKSKTKMGALNDYFWRIDNVVRSSDPLMSNALWGEEIELVNSIGDESCGFNSTFDKLHYKSDVKFIFLGTQIGDCFTYMHYMEWLFNVDYRYNRSFKGISWHNGLMQYTTQKLFVRYKGITPNSGSYKYEEILYNESIANRANIGESSITSLSKSGAEDVYKNLLIQNPYFFVDIEDKSLRDKTFILDTEMVAL